MALTFVAASGGNGGTSTTTTQATTLPTGAQAGDLLLLGSCWAIDSSSSLSVPSWILEAQSNNPNGATNIAGVFSRVMQGGDAAPTITISPTGAKRSWLMAAFRPGAGETPSILAKATTVVTASGTSHTPDTISSSDANAASFVFNGTRAQSNGSTAITQTPPTNWTEPGNGDQSTAAGTTAPTRQVGAHMAYRLNAGTGTIAPGAFTLSGGTSGGAVIDIAFHFLLRAAVAGAAVRGSARRPTRYPHYRR